MISFRSVVPMFAVVAMLAGCSAETSSTTGADSANAKTGLTKEEAGKDGKLGRHPGPPHGGPDFLVFAALHENSVNLTAEQRTTLENLVAQNKPAAPPAFDKSRMTTLASAVRSGKIDANALAVPKGDIEQKMAEHRAKSAQSLATLHATLTKEQRAALVDTILAKQAKHEARGPRPEGEAGHGPHGPGGPGAAGPMGHMLEGLDLTQAQKDQIKSQLDAQRPAAADREAVKAKFETMKKEMDAKLQTFKADSFDANAFVAPPADAPKMGPENHSEHMAKELQIIVSVLTDAQREKLAQKIEQGPPARPEGR